MSFTRLSKYGYLVVGWSVLTLGAFADACSDSDDPSALPNGELWPGDSAVTGGEGGWGGTQQPTAASGAYIVAGSVNGESGGGEAGSNAGVGGEVIGGNGAASGSSGIGVAGNGQSGVGLAGGAAASGMAGSGAAGSDDAGSGAVGGGIAGGAGLGPCNDTCPAPNGGVRWECNYRFMYGISYAWRDFGADFGGIEQWSQQGVSTNPNPFANDFRVMREHGISVVRWWMFPDFRSDGLLFNADDDVVGLGTTTLDDVRKALELADQNDLYLMFTIFSFDNFRPSRVSYDVYIPSIQPLVVDNSRRRSMIDNLVRPVAQTVEQSPYRRRMIAWDVINEPEWAVTGPSLYGPDQDFDPNPELQAVTHQQMEVFINEVANALREESTALITVGGAAMKWKNAWSNVDTDFYQLHIYDWINTYWPYDQSPTFYELTDKPLVMGEFFVGAQPLSGVDYAAIVNSWYDNGYAGALSWQFNEAGESDLDLIAVFAQDKGCTVAY